MSNVSRLPCSTGWSGPSQGKGTDGWEGWNRTFSSGLAHGVDAVSEWVGRRPFDQTSRITNQVVEAESLPVISWINHRRLRYVGSEYCQATS